jgi:hypothetical protein
VARELRRAVRKVQASYRLLGRAAKRGYSTWGRLRPQGDWPVYAAAIERQDWAALEKAARTVLARNRAVLRDLLAARRALTPHIAANAEVAAVFRKHFVPPRSRPEWPRAEQLLRRELRQRGRTAEQIERLITRLSSLDASTTPRRHLEVLRAHEVRLDGFARRAMAGLMGAHLAAAVGAFNRVARRTGPGRDAAAFARRAVRVVETAERGFHRALRRGRIPAVPLGPGPGIARLLRKGAVSAARIAAARRGSRGTTSDDRAALLAGDALRTVLRHVALRYRLTWLGATDPDSPERMRWLRMAAQRPFPTGWKPPRERSVTTLAHRPRAVRDGTPVTLAGTLGPVTIRHIGQTPVSTATLRERARSSEIVVTAKHRKFDSSGMVGGSAVRVSGSWEHRAPETAGPALRLERQRLADLATRSWSDWVTAELRQVYESSPQALTIRWSWEPGRDGAGNPLRYRVWFPDERESLR